MGFRLTTLCIDRTDRDTVCRRLAMRPSGEFRPVCSTGVCGRPHSNGAYLIVAMGDEGRHAEPDLLRMFSSGTALLVCQIHEGCMWSQMGGWEDGAQIWSVEHIGERDRNHLDVIGRPTPPFADIRARQEARQAAEPRARFPIDHLFDIAPDLYAALTGYRYDRFDPEAPAFEGLVPA